MASKSSALVNIEYVAMRGAFALLGALPRRGAIRLSTWLVSAVPLFVPKLKRIGETNLAIAFPEKTDDERREILRGTFENLGRVLGDLSQMDKYDRKKFSELIDFELDDESRDLYAKNKESRRGVLITTGHMGNWEMLVLGFAALYEPISYLARPLDNQKIDDHLNRIRTKYGNTPINKRHSARQAIRILSEGGILGILSDVNAQEKEGVFVPFFGELACTPSGAAVMALRSGAYIYPTFCIWDEAADRYRFVHGELVEPVETGDRKRDIVETTARYTAEIEKVIRAYPDQWMWIHRRWKTRPPGEPEIY